MSHLKVGKTENFVISILTQSFIKISFHWSIVALQCVKNGIVDLICKIEIETQIQGINIRTPNQGREVEELGDWD